MDGACGFLMGILSYNILFFCETVDCSVDALDINFLCIIDLCYAREDSKTRREKPG
jgi:hypothetical protein